MQDMNKKGSLMKLSSPKTMITTAVWALVGILVLVNIMPMFFWGVSNMSALFVTWNLPFSGFLASGGIVYLLVAVALIFGVFALVGFGQSEGKHSKR